jgi:hypothetical protein
MEISSKKSDFTRAEELIQEGEVLQDIRRTDRIVCVFLHLFGYLFKDQFLILPGFLFSFDPLS